MKRHWVVLFFVVFMVVFPVVAQDIDISSLNYEELEDLKKQVDYELLSRPENKYFKLEIGEYIGGTDIPIGDYFVYIGDLKNDATDIKIYDTKGEETEIWIHYPEDADNGDKRFKIEADYKIIITRGPAIFSRNTLDLEELFDPEIADGTFIPLGIYTIGDEIPSGLYFVYPSNIKQSSILIYRDDEAYNNGKYDLWETISYANDLYEKGIKLSDGNIFWVRTFPIIMKKISSSVTFN